MKTLYKILFLTFTAGIILIGCDKDKEVEKSVQEKFTEEITGTWSASSVVVDNVNLTDFNSFSLTLGDGTYSTENANGVWPATGTWSYTDTGITSITRDDNIVMTINLVDDNTLTISFIYSSSGGRTNGINDNYTFNLTR